MGDVCYAKRAAQPAFNESEDAILPEGFLFGAGSSAIQIEGAPLEDGRGLSAIEYIIQQLKNSSYGYEFKNMAEPGEAAKSYKNYAKDVEMAAALKLTVYRFSISWPRVLPEGHTGVKNAPGIQYYHNLIDLLIENNIQPMVTMYHFDYPYEIMKQYGTWSNRSIVEPFVEYANFLFSEYGEKVKLWTTINEPNYYCSTFALLEFPGIYTRSKGDDWKCVHNTILAHSKVYRLYEKNYRASQHGEIGAAALTLWSRPNSTSWDDVEAAERANIFGLGSIYHPVVFGDYPQLVKDRVWKYSQLEGLTESRLPVFSPEEKEMIKGAADFLCFNAYMGTYMRDGTYDPRPASGSIASDRDAIEVGTTTVPGQFTGMFMNNDPHVLREAPRWIHRTYNKSIFITENGWGDERDFSKVDPKDDAPRVGYHSEYLHQLLKVMKEEDIKIKGYLAWSLLDSYEWTANETRKFGLVHVDFENGSYNRSLKNSAWFFQYIGKNRRVPKIAYHFESSSSTSQRPSLLSASLVALVACVSSLFSR